MLFVIYINDLIEHCDSGSDIFLFADDVKMFSLIRLRKKTVNLVSRPILRMVG